MACLIGYFASVELMSKNSRVRYLRSGLQGHLVIFDMTIIDRFVRPYYLELLHGNLSWKPEPEVTQIVESLRKAATEISDSEIDKLLDTPEWRGRLCASWFVGLTRRSMHVPKISALLLASKQVYAGQGYCLALGLIGTDEAVVKLTAYLKEYLPIGNRYYDQMWAIGALTYVLGEAPSNFLELELWAGTKSVLDPQQGIARFRHLAEFLRSRNAVCV